MLYTYLYVQLQAHMPSEAGLGALFVLYSSFTVLRILFCFGLSVLYISLLIVGNTEAPEQDCDFPFVCCRV